MNKALTWVVAGALTVGVARGQSLPAYADVHDFFSKITYSDGATGYDGVAPQAGVTFDHAGNMYGTTTTAGENGWGMVWEITASGKYIDLHDFGGMVTNANGKTGPDGSYPDGAGVTIDSAGNLYGTTRTGGPNDYDPANYLVGDGIVWEITAAGEYKDLHDFGGPMVNAEGPAGLDGAEPDSAGVTIDAAGNLFGACQSGGGYSERNSVFDGYGMIWEITASGDYKDLHDFGGKTSSGVVLGKYPTTPVVFDSAGNMFGTTQDGGIYTGAFGGNGVIWEITASGEFRVLHDFGGTVTNANGKGGPDGNGPYSGVTLDGSGNLFGTTYFGGANQNSRGGYGILWELTKAGVYKDLHDFGGTTINSNGVSGSDGKNPYYGGVKFDAAGNMYGTAQGGGAHETSQIYGGVVWEFTKAGVYRDIHDFGGKTTNANGLSGNDGWLPMNTITFDAIGNMFGTTQAGGLNGNSAGADGGIVYRIQTVTLLSAIADSPGSVVGGNPSTGKVTLSKPSSIGGTVVGLSSNNASVKVPSQLVVPSGATSETFTIYTTAVTAKTSATITAKQGTATHTSTITVETASLAGCTVSPNPVRGGFHSGGAVTLTGPAPAGGVIVHLSSANPSLVGVPASVTVAAGAREATFIVSTQPYTIDYSVRITATYTGVTDGATLAVYGDSVIGLSISPSSLVGGSSATGTVTLHSVAPPGGWVVRLASSKTSAATVPSSVTVAAGTKTAAFTITTKAVTATTSASITASDALSAKTATITVKK